tara:strand:+ start:11104 stop:11379 length:276 start_codon:yes stop_codon:yes gene_type:complete
MKLLSNFLALLLVIVAVVAALPLLSFGFALVSGAAVLAIWILPVWIIATSEKTTGYEKIAWLLAMFCLSWFAWIFYFFLAPIKPREQQYYY